MMAESSTQQPSDIEKLISELLSEAHPLPSGNTLRQEILRGMESGETTRKASGESLNIHHAILAKQVERLVERLAEFDPAMSVELELDSLAKDIERSESPEEAVEAFVELLVAIIRHIRILSRAEKASGQRLKTSDQLAAGNASTYIQLPKVPVVIRLIVLIPSKNESAGIECLLSPRPLSSKPQYEALSYTWGDPAETRAITVNRKPFRVTKNLHIALHHLRDRVTPRVVWIDAICINQNDVPEKTHQVQLMRDIYKHASRAIVWLGQESETSAKAINFIHRLPYWISGLDPSRRIDFTWPNKIRYIEGRLKNIVQLPKYQEGWMALSELLSRPWWQRVWVSQEIA